MSRNILLGRVILGDGWYFGFRQFAYTNGTLTQTAAEHREGEGNNLKMMSSNSIDHSLVLLLKPFLHWQPNLGG